MSDNSEQWYIVVSDVSGWTQLSIKAAERHIESDFHFAFVDMQFSFLRCLLNGQIGVVDEVRLASHTGDGFVALCKYPDAALQLARMWSLEGAKAFRDCLKILGMPDIPAQLIDMRTAIHFGRVDSLPFPGQDQGIALGIDVTFACRLVSSDFARYASNNTVGSNEAYMAMGTYRDQCSACWLGHPEASGDVPWYHVVGEFGLNPLWVIHWGGANRCDMH